MNFLRFINACFLNMALKGLIIHLQSHMKEFDYLTLYVEKLLATHFRYVALFQTSWKLYSNLQKHTTYFLGNTLTEMSLYPFAQITFSSFANYCILHG